MFYSAYFSTCVTVFRGAFFYLCIFHSGSFTHSSLTQLIETGSFPNMCSSARFVLDSALFSIIQKISDDGENLLSPQCGPFRKQRKTDVFQPACDAGFIWKHLEKSFVSQKADVKARRSPNMEIQGFHSTISIHCYLWLTSDNQSMVHPTPSPPTPEPLHMFSNQGFAHSVFRSMY